MITVRLCNDYSYIQTGDLAIKEFVYSKLRWRAKDYFHKRAYKQGLWDGYKNFFSKKTGAFLTGLLPEMCALLKSQGQEVKFQDDRGSPFKFLHNNIDNQFLNQFLPKTETWEHGSNAGDPIEPITLHNYQTDFLNQIFKHRRGTVFSPTGSGKTMIMVGTVLSLPPNTPTLILQNRQGLAKQNYDELMAWGIPNLGKLWSKNFTPNTITCACVQSCHRLKDWLPTVKCVIVDEIHEMMSDEPEAVYKMLRNAQVRVALSGTPFTFGETDKVQKFKVKGYFGPVFKTASTKSGIITTKELQDQDTLSKSICYFYPVDEPQIPHHIYIDAVTEGIAQNFAFHQMVAKLTKTLKGRTLILVERLDHGDTLNKMIPGSLWVQGKDDENTREWVKKQLQRADSCVAIATQGIFNTGLNVFIHNLINVAGGQADHRIIQRMGRGLRKAKDKEILKYFDFVYRINDYLYKHSKKRIKILTEQGHNVIVKEEIDF